MVSTPTRSRVGNSGGVPLSNLNAGSPSSQSRRQSLRDTSVRESLNSLARHGSTETSSSRRSNTVNASSGGPVTINGTTHREAEGYSTDMFSSDALVQRGHSRSAPEYSGAPTTAIHSASGSAVQALLAAGPIIVSMTAERERPNPDPVFPSFLHGLVFNPANPPEWYEAVLPAVRNLIFMISCTTDLHYAANMFASSELPHLFRFVTKVAFPKFYWFSGIAHNRRHNPYFQMTASLPALEEISFTLHTAGITTSCFAERQMIQLEASDPAHAKERKVMCLQDVVQKYELNGLFACMRLRRVRIDYINCEMTTFFTKVGAPADVLMGVQAFLINGFAGHGLDVLVELARVA